MKPLEIPIYAPPGERPFLKNNLGYLSISHCKDALLIGWSKQNLGIDIERIDREFPAKILLEKFFTEKEKLILKKIKNDQLRLKVLELWTIKEAALKVNFQNIHSGMKSWEYSFEQKEVIHIIKGDKLKVINFELSEWKIAIATENQINKKDSFICF